jgi:preprotein translocase subunit SecB
MKGHPSPLKCRGYCVTELALTANPQHQPREKVSLDFADLTIEASAEAVTPKEGASFWRVALRVCQNVGPDKNSPYNFAIALLGTFDVHPEFPAERAKQLVETNGSSILYGAARQILRDAMSSGPYRSLLLPTASFVEPPGQAKANTVAEPKAPYGDGTP